MTALDWLRDELGQELSESASAEVPEQPSFDAELDLALADLGLSEQSIEILCEIAPQLDTRPFQLPELLASNPGIAARRTALGLSTADAADLVGVSPAGYEAMERTPLRWLNVPDTSKLTNFLGRLRIQPAMFLRWLASLRPAESGYAWGYRPGGVLDQPVAGASGDQAQFLEWGRRLLSEEQPTQAASTDAQLLGEVWSPASIGERAATILSGAQARLLQTDLRTDAPKAWADAVVISFDTEHGTAFPAFQFDSEGALVPIVGEINALLGAREDPWGVADWWLGDEPALGARPADLVSGSPADHDRLRIAAHELLEGE